MTHKALIRQLQISCLGLDRIDPLCLLVDDVIAALAQTERTWVGLTPQERDEINEQVYGAVPHHVAFHAAIEVKLKELNS